LIRAAGESDVSAMLEIVNDAARKYRGVIPDDRWREPYVPRDEMESEMADGVKFHVAADEEGLCGVMGIQDKGEVALIRHAYVAPSRQGKGVGSALLRHVKSLSDKPFLVGTWAAATWAVEFYRGNGFTLVSPEEKDVLLETYWSIPARQVETSVVLADERWTRLRKPHAG